MVDPEVKRNHLEPKKNFDLSSLGDLEDPWGGGQGVLRWDLPMVSLDTSIVGVGSIIPSEIERKLEVFNLDTTIFIKPLLRRTNTSCEHTHMSQIELVVTPALLPTDWPLTTN